ncbi:hypothetical protein MMC18_008540, partial [Xylographa bjoerkii]|nr:hypothetical protein [Xylographa bjoerkii]
MESFKEYEPFDVIGSVSTNAGSVFDNYKRIYGAPLADSDIQLTEALRTSYPKHIVTAVPASNCNLLDYAAAGYASAELDTTTDAPVRWRGYIFPNRRGQLGQLGDATRFARYRYKWLSEEFILYQAVVCLDSHFPVTIHYVLREADAGETVNSRSRMTDNLIKSIGEWQLADNKFVYVYDNYWMTSRALWEEVQKANWDDVILDKGMKKALQDLVGRFFDSKDVYEGAGVPWKRGVIFHGPAGNGKTISLKAIMHTLSVRKDPISTLYIKAADYTSDIGQIFVFARKMSPCLVIFEDIDTIVTDKTRSYFFNEADGLERNDGIMMIASTNHLDRLDPGLSHRPSRFDRKYLFPQPSLEERILYCEFWRHKLQNKPTIEFPELLCKAMAGIMSEFSFAYMKEAFIATLLTIAGKRTEDNEDDSGAVDRMTSVTQIQQPSLEAWNELQCDNIRAMFDIHPTSDSQHSVRPSEDDLERFEIWREMVKQVKILRDDMAGEASARGTSCSAGVRPEDSGYAETPTTRSRGWNETDTVGGGRTAQPNVHLPHRRREPQAHAVRSAGLCLGSASSFGGV